MAIDPGTAILLGNALSGGIGAATSGEDDSGRYNERQFDIDTFRELLRELEQGPMRDRLMYNLSQRLGMSPREFRPNVGGMFGMQGTPQSGGIDMNELAERRGAYTPGAGGYDETSRQLLSRMISGGAHLDQTFGRNYVPSQSTGPTSMQNAPENLPAHSRRLPAWADPQRRWDPRQTGGL